MSCPIHSTCFHLWHSCCSFPLRMGVPVVFPHVADQPHTPSSHFAGFPTWTPRSSLYASVRFDCASAGSWTLHFLHHQFAHLQTSLHLTYLIQKLANGAPTLHPFFTKFLPSLGHSFHTGAPVSIFVHFSQIISLLLVQAPVFYSHLPWSSPLAACLPFGHMQTHVTLG